MRITASSVVLALVVLLPLQGSSRASGSSAGNTRDLLGRVCGEGTDAAKFGVDPRPLDLKKNAGLILVAAHDAIEGGSSEVGNRKKALSEIEDAMDELLDSLAPDLWLLIDEGVDPTRLNPKRGCRVFHRERDCAQDVLDTINKGHVSEGDLRDSLLEAVDMLARADRGLARRAIRDAQEQGGDAHDIKRALDKLADGDELVAEAAASSSLNHRFSRMCKAIDDGYRSGWSKAVESLGGYH